MTPQGAYSLFMWIGAIGTGMVLIGFVGAWLTSAGINRRSEKEVAKLTQEVNIQRKNLEEKDQTISGLLERQRPRQLTSLQEEQFLNILKEAPKSFIMVHSPIGDPEALGFATKLQNLFQTAGWTAGGILGESIFNPPIFGVVIEVEHPESVDPNISAIQQAFGTIGIAVKISGGQTFPTNQLKLFVGHKP